jgi:hypothetical protein
MRTIAKLSLPALSLLAVCSFAQRGGAQTFPTNHLVCMKIKDPAPKASYTAHLVPSRLNDLDPCVIRVPAKMECQITGKLNVAPPAPATGPTQDLLPTGILRFLCYKVKCPKPQGPNDVRNDQFGSRTVTLGSARLLCAPASPSGAFLDDDPLL